MESFCSGVDTKDNNNGAFFSHQLSNSSLMRTLSCSLNPSTEFLQYKNNCRYKNTADTSTKQSTHTQNNNPVHRLQKPNEKQNFKINSKMAANNMNDTTDSDSAFLKRKGLGYFSQNNGYMSDCESDHKLKHNQFCSGFSYQAKK